MIRTKETRARIFAALAGAAVVAAAAWPGVAQAVSKRMQGTICHVIAGTSGTGQDGIFGIYAASNNTQVACPLAEDPDITRSSITTAEVYGFQQDGSLGNPLLYAKTCRSFSTSDGGTCSAATISSATGNAVLSPDLSAWSSNTGFAYVMVGSMQINDDVRGIYYAN